MDKAVLTFQPDAAAHARGAAGEYRVAFARTADARGVGTRVGYRVEVGEPYCDQCPG